MPVSNGEKLDELRREMAQRNRVYPRLIAKEPTRYNQALLDRQRIVLQAIIEDYERIVREEEARVTNDLFPERFG